MGRKTPGGREGSFEGVNLTLRPEDAQELGSVGRKGRSGGSGESMSDYSKQKKEQVQRH